MIGIGYHDLKGRVVVATEYIPAGVTVCASRIRGLAPERDRYSLQKDENVHLLIDEPGDLADTVGPGMRLLLVGLLPRVRLLDARLRPASPP